MTRHAALRGAMACGLAVALGGCAQRTIVVTSEPPGALVWLNDVEIGRTPVSASFLYYGTYDVQVRLDGYHAINTGRTAVAPWYEYPPIDLIAELSPVPVRTTVRWHFDLTPLDTKPTDEAALTDRAREMRDRLEQRTR